MVSVRLVTADSYQARPLPQLDATFSEFRGSEIKHVPVIRIFGTTSDGEKTCLHVHGVFPYLFVPYTGEEDPNILAYRLAASLDAAINVSLGSATSTTQHVYSIQRVSGTPFYGYHRKEHQFFKIYFYNPAMIKRAADLLQNGSVLNQSLQPHEAHINYILQFMMDYNIYGMSFVNLRFVKHRRVGQTLADFDSSGSRITSEDNGDIVYLPMEIERQSTCDLEIDALASDILNRLDIENDLELNPGLAAIWDEERARRAQAGFQGGDSQLVNPKSPPRPPYKPTDDDAYQEQRLARRLLMISQLDASTLTTTSNLSVAYAAEVRDDDNLLNASRLPNVSVQSNERILNVGQDDYLGNISFVNSPTIQSSQSITQNCSVLGTEDMPLVDLLAELAQENEENAQSVDADSLLGSQRSMRLNDHEKSDNEDEDVADLNLTSLQLASLGSLELEVNLGEKQQTVETSREKTDAIHVSPFLSPYEISCSPKSPEEDETTIRNDDDTTYLDMPQYDGAGDVSPNLLNSDTEDIQENPDNAKEFDHLPKYKDGGVKVTSSTNLSTEETSDIAVDRPKNVQVLRDSRDSDCHEIPPDKEPSSPTNVIYSEQYNNYESFDRLLEVGADFILDFVDIQSSMEIGALMCCGDSEKNDFVGETIDQEIPLETVLNGDPCFTESAEIDKSDLAELRDQYVSLLGNALLPDVHNNPRIARHIDDSSPFSETHGGRVEKTADVRSGRDERANSSSLENVAPNVQKPEDGFSRKKAHENAHEMSGARGSKEHERQTSDTSDYNCNVVATWAELQNLQIIDKTAINERLSRRYTSRGKHAPGPKSMKKHRGFRRTSPEEEASRVSDKNTKYVAFPSSNQHSESMNETLASVLRNSPNERPEMTSSCVETSEIVSVNSNDLNPSRSSNEDSVEKDLPLAEKRTTMSDALYSSWSSQANYNLAEPNFTDCAASREKIEDVNENAALEKQSSSGTSYYSLEKSKNLLALVYRQHRHCFMSRFNKIPQDRVFANDQLWIIQKRKRGGVQPPGIDERICTNEECKLPVVSLEKLARNWTDNFVSDASNDDNSVDESSTEEESGESVKVFDNSSLRAASIETSGNKTVSTQQKPHSEAREKYKKSEKSPLKSNGRVSDTEKIGTSSTEAATVSQDSIANESLVHDAHCINKFRDQNRVVRSSYNTRRRNVGKSFVIQRRRNVESRGEDEKTDAKAVKTSRKRRRRKAGSLPGIPGIPNYESPMKLGTRKIVPLNRGRNMRDGEVNESSKPMKHSSSESLANLVDQQKTTKYLPNGIVKQSPINGLVLTINDVEVFPGRPEDRRFDADSAMSPTLKKTARSRHDKKRSSYKSSNLSSTSEKLDDSRFIEAEKIRVSTTNPKQLPETVALSLMLKEAKSRSTRNALKLLLQKRLKDKYNCEKIETKSAIEKSQSNADKVREKKMFSTNLTAPIGDSSVSEIITDGTKAEECRNARDERTENSSSDINDTGSETNSLKNADSIASLENGTEIHSSGYDNSKICEQYCNSIDDGAADIFDTDTTDNSVISETSDFEGFSIVAKPLAYNSNFYENAIEEANFFAGKDYTIDAVSNEIPTCLFEDDSNSVDKRITKKLSHNEVDGVGASRLDASSESSIDPRECLDVFDVESLTSTCSLSLNDETNDTSELSIEASRVDDRCVDKSDDIESTGRAESIDNDGKSVGGASFDVSTCEEILPEDESSNDEDSPTFEALSPKPRVSSPFEASLEQDFDVDSELEPRRYQDTCDETPIERINENNSIGMTSESPNKHSSITSTSKPPFIADDSCGAIQTEETWKADPTPDAKAIGNVAGIRESIGNNTEAFSIIDSANETSSNIATEIVACFEQENAGSSIIDDKNPISQNHETESEVQSSVEINVQTEENLCEPSENSPKILSTSECENRKQSLALTEPEVESPTIVEVDKDFSGTDQNTLDVLPSCQEDDDRPAITQFAIEPVAINENFEGKESSDFVQTELSTSVEDPNWPRDIKNDMDLVICEQKNDLSASIQRRTEPSAATEDEKDFSASNATTSSATKPIDSSLERESSAIFVNDEMVLNNNENTSTLRIVTVKIRGSDTSSGETTKAPDESLTDSTIENSRPTTRIDNQEPREANARREQSTIEIEEKQLEKQLKINHIESNIKNNTSESTIMSEDNERLDNVERESVDINKNDVSVLESNDGASKSRFFDDFEKTKSIAHNNLASGAPRKRLECRPISIKLVNIDLSKIHRIALKNFRETGIQAGMLPEHVPRENEGEAETTPEVATNCGKIAEDETPFERTIEEAVGEDAEKIIVEESQSSEKKHRKPRKKIAKDTRMPERRSIRICAEMTLKLSQRESSSKVVTEPQTSREKTARDESLNEKKVPASSPENTEDESVQKSEPQPTEVLEVCSESKSTQVTAIESSTKENLRNINENPQVFLQSQQRSVVHEAKTISQELVLSEQIIVNENAAPSSLKIRRRGRLRKTPQKIYQEATLSTKIIDENTAPIYEKPKMKNSQLNRQETFVELKSSRAKPEDSARKSNDRTSTVIDAQPIDFELKIPDAHVDGKNLMISKRVRSKRGRCCKIRACRSRRKHSPPIPASHKSSRRKSDISPEFESSTEQNSMKNVSDDRFPASIFPLLASDTHNALNDLVTEKIDKKIAEKMSAQAETPRDISRDSNPSNNLIGVKIHDEKGEPQISVIRRKRGRPRRKIETSEKALGSGLLAETTENSVAEILPVLSPRKIVDANEEAKIVNFIEERDRSEGIDGSSLLPNSERVATIPDIAENIVPGSDNSPEKAPNESSEGRTTISARRRIDKSPEPKPDSSKLEKQSEASLSEESFKVTAIKKNSQKPHLLLQKVTEKSIESTPAMVVEKQIIIPSITPETEDQTLSPGEHENSGQTVESEQSSLVQSNVVKEHVKANISSTTRRVGRPRKKRRITRDETRINESAANFLECKSVPEEFAAEKYLPKRVRVARRKGRFLNRQTAGKASLQAESSAGECVRDTTRINFEQSESSRQSADENIEPKGDFTSESTNDQSSKETLIPTELASQRILSELEISPEVNPCTLHASSINEKSMTKKRVHFDGESIRSCEKYCINDDSLSDENIFESQPPKHYRKSSIDRSPTPTLTNDDSSVLKDDGPLDFDSLDLSARLNWQSAQKRNDTRSAKHRLVGEEVDARVVTRDKLAPDALSTTDTTKARELEKSRTKNNRSVEIKLPGKEGYNVHVDEKLLVTRAKRKKLPSLRSTSQSHVSSNVPPSPLNQYFCRNSRMIAYRQLQKPAIVLKRLGRKLLDSYGIIYKPKFKKFVKIRENRERRAVEEDHQIPAYDGPADLSSSDTDEEPDVTIAREEKRICSYASSKKRLSMRRDCLATPKKRKLDFGQELASSPSNKQHQATTSRDETPKKKLYRPPSRTSMLKSPGRIEGNYSPLKIIVTSPKVRKEKLEPRLSLRLETCDDGVNASSSSLPSTSVSTSVTSATTPARKNSRLRDSMLRDRFHSSKSSVGELGDKHGTVVKMGSNVVGESDEIRSIGQSERRTVNDVLATITSQLRGLSRIDDSPSSLREGKDARKKLVFFDTSVASPEKVSSFGITQVRQGASKDEAMENPTNHETTFDAVAGPSRRNDDVDLENRPVDQTGIESNEGNSEDDDDDDDVCNVTFTQYIGSQMNKDETSFQLDLDEISTKLTERVVVMPEFEPPSRRRIIDTMENYGLPKFRNQEPFFSESADVPKQKELAHKMLKVPGKAIEHLPQFASSIEGVTGLSRWRKMWLNEYHPTLARSKEPSVKLALASDARVLVTPLVRPPTRKDVKNWLKARRYLAKKKHEENEESKGEPEVPEVSESRTGADDERFSETVVVEVSAALEDELGKNTENLAGCENKKGQDVSISKDSSGSGRKLSGITDDSSITDPSLLNVLQKSHLFREQQTSKHLGISCGQIEFASVSTRSNVAQENLQNAKALIRYQYLTIMCLEVHVATREDLLPDFQCDPIAAIFYSVQSDVPPTSSIKPLEHGVIVLADTEKSKNKMYYSNSSEIPWTISFANNEEALLNSLVNLVTRVDPEILMGWQIETMSWGYVFQRASHLGINLVKRVSRIPATQYKWEYEAPDIEKLAEVKLPGRIVLDIWRLMRHEAALLSYTFESVMHHVLNERIPCPSFETLTDWWNLEKLRPSRWRVVEHYSIRVLGVLRILDQLDIVGRTSELARLFGIQFFEVFSRGSQFRVESVMLRLAKPMNYIAVSPSSLQRASMRAMEAFPLIMEPESMFYSDPVIVLDFQSLYPSIIIAHNYCFSTCLGRIEQIGQPAPFEFGAYTLRVPKSTALKLQGKVNYAPCGVAFVKPEIRTGILPRMLTEILETRFMVKKAMKDHDRDDKTLQRALHSRQMGLKFLANVTYGYTAANFSGRMPCIEVGDSVISKSKETLERAIRLVESSPKWGARVIYGDTDSLFILVPGKSKAEAFVIGNEIADAVTASNLPPIKLKFEKILFPTILQTKKRYCGYMYETPEQEIPTYLAKGIETVRRDGCPAVSKILEKSLKMLFETKDLSLLKKYVTRQLDKVLRGKVSIQDLTFAKEFRGLRGYKAKACVPTLELTRRLMRKDPRAVPRTSERVRYVIVAGAPNQALIHCVRTPWELMNDPGLRPNAIYYVTRVIIPPLNRCLNLMGVDVNDWYREMPHRQILDNPVGQPSDKQKLTIFQYFGTIVCVACRQPSNKGICMQCLECPSDTLVIIHEKLRWLDRANSLVTAICQSCVGRADAADCASLDCPVLYRRAQASRELSQAEQLRETIKSGDNFEF